MKSIYLNIILFVLALVILSCAGESMHDNDASTATELTENTIDAKEEISLNLQAETPIKELTIEQREAFQLRAIQKFYDFTDYVKIISNPSVPTDLKNHTKLLAAELFRTDSVNLDSTNLPGFNSVSISLYLELAKLSVKPIYIFPKDIVIEKQLELDSTNIYYSGVMKATVFIDGKKENLKVDIHLIDVEKSFGNTSEAIREVRLGNIY